MHIVPSEITHLKRLAGRSSVGSSPSRAAVRLCRQTLPVSGAETHGAHAMKNYNGGMSEE
jgi:hypothetical protein